MAIHKRGKQGYYSAYYRGLDERPDGTLVMVHREVNLHTADAITAAALDRQLREREARRRAELRARAFARQLMDSDTSAPVSAVTPVKNERPRRLRLDAALDAAAKYMAVSDTIRRVWTRFARASGVQYMDQVTPEIVFHYLEGYHRGKTFNNVRQILNRVFSVTRMDSGIDRSPVDSIPTRRLDSRHQRPITEEEFVRLYRAASDPWKTALLFGWHTGLREQEVAAFKWSDVDAVEPVITPGKTARFGRSVRVLFHPQLLRRLAKLRRVNEYVFGEWFPAGKVSDWARRDLAALFDSVGLHDDERGIICFNCLRDSFATRMDEEGMPRHATRGLLGHVKDSMTDLYSHDTTTARRLLSFRAPDLGDE